MPYPDPAPPVISKITSVLSFVRGRYYEVQPTVEPDSNLATSWQLLTGALPPGLSFNTVNGKISGTPTRGAEGSVWGCVIFAHNDAGRSAEGLRITIGVRSPTAETSPGVHFIFDVDSYAIGLRDRVDVHADGRAIIHQVRGNQTPAVISFVRAGAVLELDVTAIRVSFKEFDTDGTILSLRPPGETTVEKIGYDDHAEYHFWLDLTLPELGNMLTGYEADGGTGFSGLCEISITHNVTIFGSPRTANQTSQTFWLTLHDDLQPAT